MKELQKVLLRQLATYIRKHFENIEVLSITLYGERNELKPLCLNSNFVAIEETEDYTRFENILIINSDC